MSGPVTMPGYVAIAAGMDDQDDDGPTLVGYGDTPAAALRRILAAVGDGQPVPDYAVYRSQQMTLDPEALRRVVLLDPVAHALYSLGRNDQHMDSDTDAEAGAERVRRAALERTLHEVAALIREAAEGVELRDTGATSADTMTLVEKITDMIGEVLPPAGTDDERTGE